MKRQGLAHIVVPEWVRAFTVVSAVVAAAAFTLFTAERVVLLALRAGPAELCQKMVSKLVCINGYQRLTASSLQFLSMLFEK